MGENRELHTPGSDARITQGRQAAVDILEDPEVDGLNARQLMLRHEAAHGSGSDLTYPDANAIDANMQDYPADFKVDVYGDGSYTTPTVWWVALGGFGVWMLEWISPNQAMANEPPGTDVQQNSQRANVQQPGQTLEQQREQDLGQQHMMSRQETNYHGAAIGQTGASTRQELTAWIRVLAIPCRSCYATDSASMMSKALRLIKAAERDLQEEEQGSQIMRGNPFGKPWGSQVDGDLWEQAWIAVRQRGVGNQTLRKVKGHATEKDVAEVIAIAKDRDGNDKSD